ncbi:glycoside hydrolase family 31 protein [Pseudocercospora fijiensis CIRAD86]|uniref:Glycoside hydrolase family 31 protein n=1 Tax=Pseudocercospora fijiensis (strain CIRAD86) TaxID=383855 RepID=M3BB20_PSEFD|nr:glycoside hydrolase family 31 protein [Pseudocercospora fijiensis CIRAD86]EME86507.1 glycoside hydrolase family 31 protein [Pseudocercospora fijiensis CIRAD86]
MAIFARLVGALAVTASAVTASPLLLARQNSSAPSSCPGYRASDVQQNANGLTAKLALNGPACNVYGTDVENLALTVEYQTDKRLHVLIEDAAQQAYQVPDFVFPRPTSSGVQSSSSELIFDYVEDPFSFSVKRRSNGDVIFDSAAASLIFEDQYIRLRTSLPDNPNLYGTGEHTDPFRLNTTDYVRTVWNRDAYGTPSGSNLYGTHNIHYDHRGPNGTHAIFLLNSNGLNYKIDNTDGQHLEYDLLGGVVDLYFMAGPTPVEVAQQYSEVSGKSAMMPYWGLGFHQCRYGYQDVYNVAEVVANYSAANIPLETMWTDIDYMHLRWVFTLDEDRFPLDLMQQLVSTLHDRQQHYVVMVDPAVAYEDYDAFNNGVEQDIFMKTSNGSVYKGVVWPGVTAFPDWFHPNTQTYWNDEFLSFFSAENGVDIDALWIDMNDPSNFCPYPCSNPEAYTEANGYPPVPPAIRLGSPRNISGFPADFQPICKAQVTFNVDASTFFGENILVYGSAVTIGNNGGASGAAPLNANNYPIWSATVDMPANTEVTYQYVRSEPDGTFIYEDQNRTLTTGDCGSIFSTSDESITSSSPPQAKKKRFANFAYLDHNSGHLFRRQSNLAGSGDQLGIPGRDLINPGYDIGNTAGSLSNFTANTDIVQYGGYVQYDTHNIYGAMMSSASRIAMLARRPTRRPLIITRSTFAGAGSQLGKWLGDNLSIWEHYLISISENLEFAALYNVPMVGADVCGFGSDTTENLCARWASLGAFAPFYRNHNQNDAISQEFYLWDSVTKAAQNAMAIRYKLLDYIYTAFYAQNQTGTPIIQPMFFHYPEDPNTFSLGYQFFWGPGVLVAPVTVENSTSATFYLPDDIFYDYYTHEKITGTGSEYTVDDVPFTSIPVYYVGGNILAERIESANTTTELRKLDFQIVIAPGKNGSASGDLYLDDGDSLVQESYSYIHFEYSATGTFSMTGQFGYETDVAIRSIVVLGEDGGSCVNGTGTVLRLMSSRIPLTEPYEAKIL